MHFRDMTFCSSKTCANSDCPRLITNKVIEDAIDWWGDPDFPMAMADFQLTCEYYIEGDPDD